MLQCVAAACSGPVESFGVADASGESEGGDGHETQPLPPPPSVPPPLAWISSQLAGVAEEDGGCDGLRWFPERAFDFSLGYGRADASHGGRSWPVPTVVIEQDPGHVGGIVWDAETVLSHHLVDSLAHQASSGRPREGIGSGSSGGRGRGPLAGRSVVELGAGTGLAGLVAHLLGADVVVLTELPDALPLLERNVSRVASPSSHTGGAGALHVDALSWGGALGPASADHAPFDVILVADCVYVPDLYPLLVNTIRRLGRPGTEVLVAFEQRRRDISGFFDLLSRRGGTGEEGAATALASAPTAVPSARASAGPQRDPITGRFSEHAPGSDGRRQGAVRGADGQGTDSAVRSLCRVEWLESQLLAQGRALAKVHVASIVL